jgi:uncharacterized membrane protein
MVSLGPVAFLSGLFLVGAVSAVIPLIIHLSRSRRTKKIRFSTTRFFTDQFLRSYRMSRLKELFLLACRMALCILFAGALARPLFLPKGQSFLMGGTRAVVLVIDNSASMGYTENGTTLLDRARATARELLADLGRNDTVSVVLAGRRGGGPEVLYEKKPAQEVSDVVQAVNTLPVAALGTDLGSAVDRAEAILKSTDASSKEAYVLSDLQDSGLTRGDEVTAAQGGSDIAFFFVRLRPQTVSNLAVTAVQYATARPMVGVPFMLRAHVSGQGEQTKSGDVRLYVDGQKVSEKPLEKLQNGRWAVPRFYHTFTRGGWHSGYVEVQDETLAQDNRRYFAVEVLDSVRVLAVDGAPSQIPRLDELFFLKTALTASVDDKSPVQIDVIGAASVANTDLTKYPLVILANVEGLPDPALERLERFVDRGGSLLITLGEKVNANFYNQKMLGSGRLNGGLLPGPFLGLEGNPAGPDNFTFISQVDYDHPALAAFQDPKFTLAGVTFKALWKADAGQAAVLMKAGTGAPLLCEKDFGKGKVMLFTSTCDRDWTNFPVRPAYLPWIHRLVAYLAQEPTGRQGFFATGDWVPVPVSTVEQLPQVVVERFDSEKNLFRTVGPATVVDDPDGPQGAVVFQNTSQPGIYRITTPDKKDNAPLVAINLASEESKLTYLDDAHDGNAERIKAYLKEYFLPGRPLVSYVEDPARVSEVSQSARRGIRLWDVVLLVVLVIAILEPWLANRISIRHYARPKELTDAGRPSILSERQKVESATQEVGS